MSKVIYSPVSHIPLRELLSPVVIANTLWKYRQLTMSFARRDFHATHRETYLGIVWSILSPLIMLAMFTFVFGYIFKGRFNVHIKESPIEFALALFVGLSLFNMVAQMLGGATNLMIANSMYVKTLQFPVEILPVAFVMNAVLNLVISLSLCLIIALLVHGSLPLTAIALPLLIIPLVLICLGLAWILSAVCVFVRDISSITGPLTTVLMFCSLVFFPLSAVSRRLWFIFDLNPLAVLIESARGAVLYGVWPNMYLLAGIYVFALLLAMAGYGVFIKAKSAFADVL